MSAREPQPIPADEMQIATISAHARRLGASPGNIRFLVRELTGRGASGGDFETIARALSYGEAARVISELSRRIRDGAKGGKHE